MTDRDELVQNGYLVYSDVIPVDLRNKCSEDIRSHTDEKFLWIHPEFQAWVQQFLESKNLNFRAWHQDFHAFNRYIIGSQQWWHEDSGMGQNRKTSSTRRVFACIFFDKTTRENAGFRVIPKSHLPGTSYENLVNDTVDMIYKMCNTEYKLQMEADGKTFQGEWPQCFNPHPDELALDLPAGSIVVCDERILHGTAVNTNGEHRPMALYWLQKNPEDAVLI